MLVDRAAQRACPQVLGDALREQAAQGVKIPRVVPIDRLSSGQMAMLSMTAPLLPAVLPWLLYRPLTTWLTRRRLRSRPNDE